MKKVISIICKFFGWSFLVLFALGIVTIPVRLNYGIPSNIAGTLMLLAIGLGFRKLGDKLSKSKVKETPIQERSIEVINQPIPKPTKKRKNIKWKKIFATIGLAGIFGYCIGCIDEGDSLTAWMIITYIPMFIILYVYYVRLIWKHGRRITKEQLLLLPLLQKISIFRDYSGDIEDRKRLFSTSFYGIVLSVLCTAIVSTMYYDMSHGIRDYYGICYMLLSLPIVIWIIGITRAAFQNWLSISITINKYPTDDKAE